MFGYILFIIAMTVMVACIAGAVICSNENGKIIDMEMNEKGEFVEVVLVK